MRVRARVRARARARVKATVRTRVRVGALVAAEVTHAHCGVRVELPPAALVGERLAEVAQHGRIRSMPACEQQLVGLCQRGGGDLGIGDPRARDA